MRQKAQTDTVCNGKTKRHQGRTDYQRCCLYGRHSFRYSRHGTAGYGIFQTNKDLFYGLLGLSLNRESFTNQAEGATNVEALLALNYQLYIYDSPKASLSTDLVTFPGLTDWGRIRVNYNITLSWEIIIDLFWELSGYYSYDNKPTSGASSNDYYINTAFKFEF